MEKYDEDVYENPFFTALQNDYSQLYDEATSLRCTVRHNYFVFAIFIISTTCLNLVSVLQGNALIFFSSGLCL